MQCSEYGNALRAFHESPFTCCCWHVAPNPNVMQCSHRRYDEENVYPRHTTNLSWISHNQQKKKNKTPLLTPSQYDYCSASAHSRVGKVCLSSWRVEDYHAGLRCARAEDIKGGGARGWLSLRTKPAGPSEDSREIKSDNRCFVPTRNCWIVGPSWKWFWKYVTGELPVVPEAAPHALSGGARTSTHFARQRVSLPQPGGRHQRVWDRERR